MAVAKVILNGTTLIDTTQKTVTAGSMLNGVTALKNDGTDITGSIASKTSSDLTASGATVTAPAGYYASSASKSVSSGSATTPATTITANPSISVSSGGLITASVSASQSVTPTVSAGYVSSGTAGTVSVSGSNTSQLTTQAAQTITPTTTNQTIASGKYLTGTQTILGDQNLLPENIKKDVSIFNVTGTLEGGGDDMDIVVRCNAQSFTNNASDYVFEVGSFIDLINKVINGDHVTGIAYCRLDAYDDEEDFYHRGDENTLYLYLASAYDYGGWWDQGSIEFCSVRPVFPYNQSSLTLQAKALTISGNDDPDAAKSFYYEQRSKTW